MKGALLRFMSCIVAFSPAWPRIFFNRPSVSHIDLDAFGSALWLSMDGKKNVGDLAQMMESRFGKQVYPLYERLIVFFADVGPAAIHYVEKNLIGSCFSLRLKARKRHGALLKRRLPALKWKILFFWERLQAFLWPFPPAEQLLFDRNRISLFPAESFM